MLRWVLLGAFAVSLLVILLSAELKLPANAEEFKNSLELFAFPLGCIAALITASTLEVAIDQLQESARQSATAAWESTQASFLTFSRDQQRVPITAFAADHFPTRFQEPKNRGELFAVRYAAPTITLSRLLDPNNRYESIHFGLSHVLTRQLKKTNDVFARLESLAKQGDERWLVAFVDLAVLIRQLRLYLVVDLERMSTWDSKPVLETVKELGSKRKFPAFSSFNLAEIAGDMRTELLCVANVLLFASAGQEEAAKMASVAFRVGLLWNHSNDRLKAIYQEYDLHEIWNQPTLVAARIEL